MVSGNSQLQKDEETASETSVIVEHTLIKMAIILERTEK